jgi:hypothetical protein
MKVRSLIGLSLLLTSQIVFAQTCKEDLEKICSTCRFDDLCEAVEKSALNYQNDDFKKCIRGTINSMDPNYFQIQQRIEDRNNPPKQSNYKQQPVQVIKGNQPDAAPAKKKKNRLPGEPAGDVYYYGNNSFGDVNKDGGAPYYGTGTNHFNSDDGISDNSGSDSKSDSKSGSKNNSADNNNNGWVKTDNGWYNENNGGSNNGWKNDNYNPPPVQQYRAFGFADKIVRDCEDSVYNRPGRSRTNVKVVGETNFHSSSDYPDGKKMQLGGLSGIFANQKTKELMAISDEKDQATMAFIKWSEEPDTDPVKPFKFKISKHQFLERNYNEYEYSQAIYNDKDFKAPPKYKKVKESIPIDLDREDIVALPNGNILISSETSDSKIYGNPDKPVVPTLFQEFTPDGKFVRGLPSPTDFVSEYKFFEHSYECPVYNPPPQDPTPAPAQQQGGGSSFGPTPTPAPVVPAAPSKPKKSSGFSFFGSLEKKDSNREPCGDDKKSSKKNKTAMCYTSGSEKSTGLEFNKGIEAMTIVPGSDEVLFANEAPLTQDLKKGFFNVDNFVRIYSAKVSDWSKKAPTKYFKYPMGLDYDNGVPAMLALNSSTVLVLERGFDAGAREAVVRLYKVELAEADKDGELHKELIVDFQDLKPQFSAGFKKIDNFEGMALGPVRNGQQIIFLVSDNNFSSSQRTTFLALAIPQGALK